MTEKKAAKPSGLHEFFRKRLVGLKRKPHMIGLAALAIIALALIGRSRRKKKD